MSRNSYNHNSNQGDAFFTGEDDARAANSDQMFNALMNQYLAQSSTSSAGPSIAYISPHPRQPTDPRATQPLQRTSSSPTGNARPPSRSQSWNAAAGAIPGYTPLPGAGQALPSIASFAGQQPSFSDLMREMSHEQSRALYVFPVQGFPFLLDPNLHAEVSDTMC